MTDGDEPPNSGPTPPPGPLDETSEERAEREGHFGQYWRYATHLRNWFIAFGVGGLLVLTRSDAVFGSPSVNLAASRPARLLAIAFLLLGIVSQVILAFVNKVSTWYVYQSYFVDEEGLRHRAARALSNALWPDILLDLVTIGLFTAATAVMAWILP